VLLRHAVRSRSFARSPAVARGERARLAFLILGAGGVAFVASAGSALGEPPIAADVATHTVVAAPAVAPAAAEAYASGGIAACLECHDETEEHPVLSIFKTPHATLADPDAPLASELACQVCHGPSADHVDDSDKPPGLRFRPDQDAEAQNQACLACHTGGARMNWGGSTHESRQVSCVSCHTIHADQDAVLRNDLQPQTLSQQNTQAGVCFECHQEQRAEIQRVSSHPIRQGTVACSDCHNPHGSAGPHNLTALTVNETCYQCHAEKRGPFLWEHGPVREDCTTCHTPHGSIQPALLTSRMPFLCQECHLGTRHVSTQYAGDGVVSLGGAEDKLLGKSCTNCHVEIHGSNHPSGVRWTR